MCWLSTLFSLREKNRPIKHVGEDSCDLASEFRKRVLERPDVFRRLAELKDREFDAVMRVVKPVKYNGSPPSRRQRNPLE